MSDFKQIIKQIKDQYIEDYKIDLENLSGELNNSTIKHAKYIEWYLNSKYDFILLKKQESKIYNRLHNYYSGKADPEVYKEKPFNVRVLKSDIDSYIKSDEEYQEIDTKIQMYDAIIKELASIVDAFKWRKQAISTALEAEKFRSGVQV